MAQNSEAAEIAEDYRFALEDNQGSRHEIMNLTNIAREQTEFAHTIADVLMDHIKKVAPQKKLVALYVLDSIVKNVGTPYTIFFGRNLYKLFMEAYAIVDHSTRRKMVEMAKTWREPVPGSIDPRPVFDPEIVGPIESSLAKIGAIPSQAQPPARRPLPVVQNQQIYRQTPTPPNMRPQQAPPGPYGQPPYPPANGNHRTELPPSSYPVHQGPQYPSHSNPQAPTPPVPYAGGPALFGTATSALSSDTLNGDIAKLIVAFEAEAAQNPYDGSIKTRLEALRDLQRILKDQDLPPEQLVLVKDRVAELAKTIRVIPGPVAPGPVPPPAPVAVAYQTSTPTPPQIPLMPRHPPAVVAPVAAAAPAPAPAAQPKLSLDSLFGSGALAALRAHAAQPTASNTLTLPLQPAGQMAVRSPPTQPPQQSAKAPTDTKTLIEMLRKNGLLSSKPPAPVPPRDPKTLDEAVIGIELQPRSLSQWRPYLVSFLYEKLGPQCSQCGRRFTADEEGRAKKTAHMDWHFRMHQRIAEAEKRGQHRSWYVLKDDWVVWKETVDADHYHDGTGNADGRTGSGPSQPKMNPKDQWLRVPDDNRLAKSVCPICQEKFQTTWLDEAQEFVWMDAVKVGDRIYHATCHAEATRDRERTPMRGFGGTPEPVLGKRKAESDDYPAKSKMKLDV